MTAGDGSSEHSNAVPTSTYHPATDLGYLLAKNPARAQTFELAFGKAHVVYPEASPERCTAALLLDIDPVALVRGRGEGAGPLDQYVNDRPYVASSFLSVAIAEVVRRLFAPLGYKVETVEHPLDPQFPAWGISRWTRPSTTTSATTSWRSCCDAARAGWRRTPSAS